MSPNNNLYEYRVAQNHAEQCRRKQFPYHNYMYERPDHESKWKKGSRIRKKKKSKSPNKK